MTAPIHSNVSAEVAGMALECCALTGANQGSLPGGRNEDAMLVDGEVIQGEATRAARLAADCPLLFAISDGVHCSPQPQQASRLLLEELARAFREEPEAHPATRLKLVHERYVGHALRQPRFAGMTATLVAAEIRGRNAVICHVGDSPAWLVRDGRARRLTRDHTILERMIEDGDVERSQAAGLASIYDGLDRYFAALADEERPQHDHCPITLNTGDVLLLASDGISVLTAGQIGGLDFSDLPAAAMTLFRLAQENGSDDNITLILVRVPGLPTDQRI